MSNLTRTQHKRRTAILDRIKDKGPSNTMDLVSFLKRYHGIHVTEDTVGKDLRDMKAVGTLWRKRTISRRFMYGLCPGRWDYEKFA